MCARVRVLCECVCSCVCSVLVCVLVCVFCASVCAGVCMCLVCERESVIAKVLFAPEMQHCCVRLHSTLMKNCGPLSGTHTSPDPFRP